MKKFLKNTCWIYNKCKSSIIYIVIIIILCSIISLISVGTAMVTKYLIDSASNNNSYGIKKWLLILSLLLGTRILLNIIQTIISTYATEKTKNLMQKYLYTHIINSIWMEHNKFHSVDLLTRITNDVNTIVSMLVITLPTLIGLLVMLVSSFFALLSISPFMSLFAIAIFPLLVILSKFYGRKLRYFYISIQKKEAAYNRFLQESFNNILIIKSFCLENRKKRELTNIQNEKLNLAIKKSYFSCISNASLSLSSIIGYIGVFSWGSINLFSNMTSNFGNLTAMLQLFNNIQNPLYELSSTFPQLISALAAVDRLLEIEDMSLEEQNKIHYNNYHLEKFNSCFDDAFTEAVTSSNTDITFHNVNFKYSSEKTILSNVSFNMHSGEIIGLVGPSGEGKTTLIRLLLSLIYPNSGEIYINNELLHNFHRDLISYVPQGNTLFSGSILDNLKLGNPYADNNELKESLIMSCAFDFVNSLPLKTDTIIGEKGVGISEGQAQRIAIARAFLRKKPILILDEATSSLDSETELKVLNSVKQLNYNPICIIITHRPSALSICDKIYKLENQHLSHVQNVEI